VEFNCRIRVEAGPVSGRSSAAAPRRRQFGA
jgi:hypothetical protein